jgi:nucleotide-binding universal stress UspA family protein
MTVTSGRPTIVVGVDESAQAIDIVRYALGLASERGMDLLLAHAWSFPWAAGYFTADDVRAIGVDARAAMTSIIDRLDVPAGVTVGGVLSQGPVVPFLRRLSATAAIMVVGRHEHWAARIADGDVSSALAANCQCPVIAVPSEWAAAKAVADGPVVVCLDGDTSAGVPLEFAFGAADVGRRDLVIFHAIDLGHGVDAVETERRDIAEITAGWQERFPGVPVRYESGFDDAGKAIALASHGASMVVVGSPHTHRRTWSWMHSVARGVVDRIDCPLAIAPARASVQAPARRVERAAAEPVSALRS